MSKRSAKRSAAQRRAWSSSSEQEYTPDIEELSKEETKAIKPSISTVSMLIDDNGTGYELNQHVKLTVLIKDQNKHPILSQPYTLIYSKQGKAKRRERKRSAKTSFKPTEEGTWVVQACVQKICSEPRSVIIRTLF